MAHSEINQMSAHSLSLRRGRLSAARRALFRDVHLSENQFLQPYFVAPTAALPQGPMQVPGLPGVFRDNEEAFIARAVADREAGVSGALLFTVPQHKKAAVGAETFDLEFSARAIEKLRAACGPDYFIATDVCFCSHTEHGHCGILNEQGDHLKNAETVDELARAAVAYAAAGADCVAPSDMMDGRVGAMRRALNTAGHDQTLLMSYSVKLHSKFYGPFREAADSAPKGSVAAKLEVKLKDRATYQLDPLNSVDARACALRDAQEGADILMVKPGLPALDLLATLSKEINHLPWAVYEVSGEYAAVEALAAQGLMNGPAAHVESWAAFARAGAQVIISYGARHARRYIREYL